MQTAFLSDDEVLDGLSKEQILKRFAYIERRAELVLTLSTYALKVLLLGSDGASPNLVFDDIAVKNHVRNLLSQQQGRNVNTSTAKVRVNLSGRDIEQAACEWASLVPQGAVALSAIAHLLSHKYQFQYEQIPYIREALNIPEIAETYEKRYGEKLSSAFNTYVPDESQLSTGASLMVESARNELIWKTVKRGETLFQEGEVGEALYVLCSGQMAVRQGKTATNIARLMQGEVFGEMALLSQEPRTATVIALRDSVVMEITRASFEKLSRMFPNISIALVSQIVHRLRKPNNSSQKGVRTVTIVGLNGQQRPFTEAIVKQLKKFGTVLHLNSENIDEHAYQGALAAIKTKNEPALISAWLNEQEVLNRFVVYEADADANAWTLQALHQSDEVLLVADADAEPSLYPIEKAVVDFDMDLRCGLILLHENPKSPIRNTAKWLEARSVDNYYHASYSEADTIGRIARHLAGRLVGVVFSGGGARGFAHIGVVKALNELNIPIDIVVGVSAGAVLGGFAAQSRSVEEATSLGMALFHNYVDYTLPLVSLASGHRMTNGLKKIFGETMIEDLWTRFVCISTNSSTMMAYHHERGLLWRAIRASASIPGIFPPVIADNETGDILLDGAIMSNMPTDALKDFDPSLIIAVDISGDMPRKIRPYNHGDSLSGLQLLWNRINPFRRQRIKAPNLISTLLRVIMLNGSAQVELQRRHADILIAPDLRAYDIFDTNEAPNLIQIGYETTLKQLGEWAVKNPQYSKMK